MKGVRGIFRPKGASAATSGAADPPGKAQPPAVVAPPVASSDSWQMDLKAKKGQRTRSERAPSAARDGKEVDTTARPSYRGAYSRGSSNAASSSAADPIDNNTPDDDDEEDDEDQMVSESESSAGSGEGADRVAEVTKARHIIEKSAGTNRLNRILSRKEGFGQGDDDDPARNFLFNREPSNKASSLPANVGRIADPKNIKQVANFSARLVVPPIKVDRNSIGGVLVESTGYPETMQQETLLCFSCNAFEAAGTESVQQSALQYPADFKKHKRSLGFFGGTTAAKGRNKFRYVLVARSTNKPLVAAARTATENLRSARTLDDDNSNTNDGSERGDYDAMFSPDEDGSSRDMSMDSEDIVLSGNSLPNKATSAKNKNANDVQVDPGDSNQQATTDHANDVEEISSFPILICMTLHSSGSAPDIRKLIRLDQLTTVQDLHTTVVQLAFANGDTIRLDFGNNSNDEYQVVEGAMDKERFIWSLIQVHAMLCVSVAERNAMQSGERIFLPSLNVRNLDRAELQYVATVNGFLRKSETLPVLLERQRKMVEFATGTSGDNKGEEKVDLEEMDNLAYDVMMGNFASRVTIFQSDDERKDAEEVLNATEWTHQLDSEDNTTAISIAERLGLMLQWRMRDLEAETCRRLIAWEDEKHYSVTGKSKFLGQTDERDSVDALALASLFKTLETLDGELQEMEEWLQERAAAIKPLTDDCADIEEENRQLEQQWKSYETLGLEVRRLLTGLDIDADMERALKNPASALVYEDNGSVDVEESEAGVEQIYEAGKALQEAVEYPRRSGGIHLRAVSERAKGLNKIATAFCKQLAQIIVTVMEQFKTEVVAGSDHGKVSKNDTHSMIAKKIRDTQRKFQSALLGYLKLIEILIALSPEMLPALRDAYSEMVSEGILMKKRMKGYFQALPGKNAAYLNRAGIDLKDYAPSATPIRFESVNARDIKAALTELLPVIAREAYFTSALFGTSTKDQDGREKKRNFENAKVAVGNSSQHFRYYINRTCGIMSKDMEEKSKDDDRLRADPLLCLVASIYLNEVMENYIDREKKGGDHSLSLAYVRATILDLRKRADKQWMAWVDKQIEWIRSSDGVPLTGKRAGVFPSFLRFFTYCDHVLFCCREGRSGDYTPDLSGVKVINYYMQKMASALLDSLRICASRETTDKQYASNVMQMENTYFFTQAVKERGPQFETLFAKQVVKASVICKDSTDAYLGWMIKREFTVLHELFSRVSKMRKEIGDSEVAKNIPKAQFVRTLTKEANRDILKEKIGSMYSRMEKHLHEDGRLLPVAWKALVKVLYEWFGRWEKLSLAIYRHKIDPSPVNVVRIAKAVGGGTKPKPQVSGSEFALKNILALGNKPKDDPI
jgi:hypothetical protein